MAEASNNGKFIGPKVVTSKNPTGGAEISVNGDLLATGSFSGYRDMKKGTVCNLYGVLNYSSLNDDNTVSSFYFSLTKFESMASLTVNADNIGAVAEANTELAEGATSEKFYSLTNTVYAGVRTDKGFFAYDETGPMGFVPDQGVSMANCNYVYGASVHGLLGRVTKQNGLLVMTLNSFPASDDAVPANITVTTVDASALAENAGKMVRLENVVLTATDGVLYVAGKAIVTPLNAAEGNAPLQAGPKFELTGVYDGNGNFILYSSKGQTPAPEILPAPAEEPYIEPIEVSIKAVEGATSYYTTDGTTPEIGSE